MSSCSDNMLDALVIGGGISGLSASWWLDKAGLNVELWEADSRFGGKIKTEALNGYRLEASASLLMNFRSDVSAFINSTGLAQFKAHKSALSSEKRYLINDGELLGVPADMRSMMRAKIWRNKHKLRLASEIFIPRGGHQNESAASFIRRRFGSALLDKAIAPYISGILACDPEKACATSVLPRLTELERRYGSITLGVLLRKLRRKKVAMTSDIFSFNNGMQTLVDQLEPQLQCARRRQHRVTSVEKLPDGWLVNAETPYGQISRRTRQLIMCVPSYCASTLVSDTSPELSSLLNRIDYTALKVVHLGFDRNAISHLLDGTGFLSPPNEGMNINGCMWMSSLFDDRAPKGKVLLSCYMGGATRPDISSWTDEQCIQGAIQNLSPLLKILQPPDFAHVISHDRALPLYHGDYASLTQAIEQEISALAGLHLNANYLHGISIRDRLAEARTVANTVIKQLSKTQPHRKFLAPQQLVPVYE